MANMFDYLLQGDNSSSDSSQSSDTTAQQQPNMFDSIRPVNPDYSYYQSPNYQPGAPNDTPDPQPSIWDQLKNFDIKGLTGGNATAPAVQPDIPQPSLPPGPGLSDSSDSTINGPGPNSQLLQYNPSIWDKIVSALSGVGKAFNSGGKNSPLVTGLTKGFLGNNYNSDPAPAPYVPQNIAETLASGAGEQAAEWPLWMVGGAVAKGAMGAAEAAIPAMDYLPNAIKSGLELGATYGGTVAPAETALQGDGLQGLLNREKQVPEIALGGSLLHGAGQLLGAGIDGVGNYVADRNLGQLTQPLEDAVQSQYNTPSLLDAKTQNYANIFADTPDSSMTTATPEMQQQSFTPTPIRDIQQLSLQQGIDNTTGVSNFLSPLERSQKQDDLINAFRDMPNRNTYSFTTGEQRALNNLQDGIQTAQNYIGHTDVLTGYPPGTSVDQAYADVKANTGIDLPQLMTDYEKAQNVRTSLTPQELQMGRVAGVIPDLAPRDGIKPPEPTQPAQPNIFDTAPRTLPENPGPLTWTNKEGIPKAEPAYQGLANGEKAVVDQPKLSQGTGASLMDDAEFWNKVKSETGWKGDTNSLQEGIKSGQVDTSNLSMANDPRLNMDLQKFAENEPNKYIHETPMNFTPDSTKQDLLHQYVGNRDTNILNVNNLANDIRNNVKDPLNRMAATHYIQAGGDLSKIQNRLSGKDGFMSALEGKISDLNDTLKSTDMEPQAKKAALKTLADYQSQLVDMQDKIPSNLLNLDRNYIQNGKDTGVTYKQTLERAKNLDPNTKKWADEALTHNAELGEYSQKLGNVDNLEEYHMAQSWENPKLDSMNPDKLSAMKDEALQGKVMNSSTEGTGTNHNAHKVYPDYATGIMDGRTPRTMDMADIIQREGVDMASKNANTEFVKGLLNSGIAQATDIIPDGYKGIYKAGGHNIVVPKQLGDALSPLMDPDFISKSERFKTLTDFQNKLKTINLGFSLFHYKNLAIAGLSNGDYKAFGELLKAPTEIFKKMEDPVFRASEQDMIKTGQGMTSMVKGNLDTNMKLGKSLTPIGKTVDDFGSKVGSIPYLGKVLSLPEKGLEFNNKVLFDGVQRFYKVQAYATKVAAYIGDHPESTPEELFKAKGSIAREINGTFGGLNWDSLGTNKTMLGIAKRLMLSPDWTYSNIDLAKQALSTKLGDPGGNAAKAYWLRAAIVGFGILEGSSYAATGHFTNQNPKGHETDVEMSPNVWGSPFGGAIGDALKLTGDMVQHGTQGIPQFLQGKLSPIIRTAMGLLSNRNYYGQQIAGPKDNALSGTLNAAKFIGENLLPMPFATSPLANYLSKPDNPETGDQKTIPGGLMIATGLGRYSADKPISAYANPATAYSGNWLNSIVNPADGASNALIDQIKAQKAAQSSSNKQVNQSLGSALANGKSTANIFTQGTPVSRQNQMIKAAKSKLNASQLSPLGQEFQGLSRTGQQQFLSQLSPDQRATLGNVKVKTK